MTRQISTSTSHKLTRTNRLDGLWNEDFQTRIRAAILGEATDGDNFEWTVRKAIDSRLGGVFIDGAQAVNYITKHDVEGFRHERLFTELLKSGMSDELIEKRIKLGFVCLMTAVGIPMFLAGEEFGDRNDFFDESGNVTQRGGKQVDPVNFGRLIAGPPDPRDPDPRDNERPVSRAWLRAPGQAEADRLGLLTTRHVTANGTERGGKPFGQSTVVGRSFLGRRHADRGLRQHEKLSLQGRQMLAPLSMRRSWKRRISSGVAVSGKRFSQAANRLQLEMWLR